MDSLGYIFDIKRYALHDGDGIRTTVFFKGCPLTCQWCSNPESQKFSAELAYRKDECIHCTTCVESCPEDALSHPTDSLKINRGLCNVCGTCVQVCPTGALQHMGRQISTRDLYKEVSSDRPFWERSGGGITVSGGEPLAQAEFLQDFLTICKDGYVDTSIETCLHVSEESVRQITPLVDKVICDLKLMDSSRHYAVTGAHNTLILKNIEYILKSDTNVLVRIPFIPGINDNLDNLKATCSFLESHRKGVELELLPYHRFGEAKYERLDRVYQLPDVRTPSEETMVNAKNIAKEFDLRIVCKFLT